MTIVSPENFAVSSIITLFGCVSHHLSPSPRVIRQKERKYSFISSTLFNLFLDNFSRQNQLITYVPYLVVKNDGKLSKDMSQITSECLSIRFSYEYV